VIAYFSWSRACSTHLLLALSLVAICFLIAISFTHSLSLMADQHNTEEVIPRMPPPRLEIGQQFLSVTQAANHLRDHCNHFFTHFTTLEHNSKRYQVICGDQDKSGCKWEVRFFTGQRRDREDRGGQWEITMCNSLHTCSGCRVPSKSSQHSKIWLVQKVSGRGRSPYLVREGCALVADAGYLIYL
jgi:hypothetical protein